MEMRVLAVILICLILRQPVFAQPCDHPSPTAPIKQVVDNIEESPFMVACKKPPGLLKDRPKTGLLHPNIPPGDGHGRSTREFLKRVLAKVRGRIEASRWQGTNLETCLDRGNTPECEEVNQWADKELPRYLKAARWNLSLAQSNHQLSTWFDDASHTVNGTLSGEGTSKYEKWAPLTADESSRAAAQLKKYESQIDSEGGKRFPLANAEGMEKFKNQSLIAVRYNHYLTYRKMIGDLPLLQHLHGPEVTHNDLRTAITDMRGKLDQESKYLDRFDKLLAKNPLPNAAMDLMAYNSEVEETLLDDNRDCGIAASMVYTIGNRKMDAALLTLPILAASAFAPPLLGVGAAVGAGGVFTYSSYTTYKAAQRDTLGHIYGDGSGIDLQKLDDAHKQFEVTAITVPLGMGAGSLAVKGLSTVGSAALSAGFRMFEAAP